MSDLSDILRVPVVPIASPWRDLLITALMQVRQHLFLISPYIQDDAVALMQEALQSRPESAEPLTVRVITRALPAEFLAGSSDINALFRLLSWPTILSNCRVDLRAIDNVHAKVWLCDEQLALIGSGNATMPGLESNLEYGVALSDTVLVGQIVQYWNSWWEQASPIEYEPLAQLRSWLVEAEQSAEVQLEREQRRMIERRLRNAPRIGKRAILTKQAQQARKPVLKESATVEQASQAETQPMMMRQMGRVALPDLWYALLWACPLADEQLQARPMQQRHIPSSPLKLTWQLLDGQQALLLTWADGRRFSRATIAAPALNLDSTDQFWSITLAPEQVNHLVAMLLEHSQPADTLPDLSLFFSLILSSSQMPTMLSLSPESRISEPYQFPCTVATPAGNVPLQRPPLTQIAIEHAHLTEALTALAQEWEQKHDAAHPLRIVEMGFTVRQKVPYLVLSTGQIAVPAVLSVPVSDYTVHGPELHLRLDVPSLHQVLASAQGRVQNWHLTIDRDATSIHFSPEPSPVGSSTLLWRHELRHQDE